ncbi:MAG: hypothetical protein Q7V19_09965 [Bacteroidales bacterium]|nr:hypothetical protein [Bacteroidales bacterium]MDP2238415.1 hypothetical protein [Bacteroidales bacterium]
MRLVQFLFFFLLLFGNSSSLTAQLSARYSQSDTANIEKLNYDNYAPAVISLWNATLADSITNDSQKTKPAFERGYRGYLETGLDLEFGRDGHYNWYKINFINAYQFNPGLTLGIGTGLRKNLKRESLLVPVFLSMKAYSNTNKSVNPYFSLQGGITLNTTMHFSKTGYFISPQIGVRKTFGRKSGIYAAAGMEMKSYVEKGGFSGYSGYNYPESSIDMMHISFVVGWEF